MKITDITVTPLKTRKGLLRIQTDAGVEGWAEAPGVNRVVPGRNSAVFEAYLESIIKPAIVGEDPLQIDRIWETLALGKDDRLYNVPAPVVGVSPRSRFVESGGGRQILEPRSGGNLLGLGCPHADFHSTVPGLHGKFDHAPFVPDLEMREVMLTGKVAI